MRNNSYFAHILMTALLLNPILAYAADAALSVETIPLVRFASMIFLASWGGVARLLERLATGEEFKVSRWLVVARDMVTSTLAGTLFFFACVHFAVPAMLTAMIVTIAGYGGSRTLEAAFKKFEKSVDEAVVK